MKNYKEKSKENFDIQVKIYDESDYNKYPRESYPYVTNALSELKFEYTYIRTGEK